MIDLNIGQAQKLTAPSPFALLSTVKADGTNNLMAVSWWTYLSNHPPMLGVCLSKKGLSGSLIEESGEFTLNIVGEDLRQSALECGRCSGRTINKAAEFAIPTQEAAVVKPLLVSQSKVAFECRLVSQAEAGDHMFYIAELVSIHGNPELKQLFAYDGYARLDII